MCNFQGFASPTATPIFAPQSTRPDQSKKEHHVTEVAKLCPKKSDMSQKWHVIYTRPRWEKKVHNLLIQKGIESYCPLNKVHRRWSDRIKLVEEPLFKSYVFIRMDEQARTDVRMTEGVINFVYWDGKPAVVREKEIQAIRKFLGEYENVELVRTDLKPNERVAVTSGPLMNQEGKVLELKNKVVKVLIESLGYFLVAYIDRSKLVSIETN
jgi:transcription antitermination factor NusG